MNVAADNVTAELDLVNQDSDVPANANAAVGRLEILSGVQQGASAVLWPASALTLGSDLDCDIVLRDVDVQPQHLTVTLNGSSITIQCLDGMTLVDGIVLPEGQSMDADASVLVQMGAAALMIDAISATGPTATLQAQKQGPTGSESVAGEQTIGNQTIGNQTEASESLGLGNDRPSLLTPSASDLPSLVNDSSLTKNKAVTEPDSKFGFFSGSLTLSVLFLGAVIVWQSGLFREKAQTQVSLADSLAMSAFAGLTVSQTGNAATVSGFVDTFGDALQLEVILNQTGLAVHNKVIVGESLGEQVTDLFRVNGVTAEVSVEPGSVVTATMQVADTDLLAVVEERVLSDIPDVAELRIMNTPPEVVEPVVPSNYKPDPGKRVALVVSDEVAYVVTEDQSRYFVGSLLPTGHRIVSIIDGDVSLEKNGVVTTLDF